MHEKLLEAMLFISLKRNKLFFLIKQAKMDLQLGAAYTDPCLL